MAMPAWTLQFIPYFITLVISLVGSAFTAFLTVRFALWRFKKEHWWERKVDAYSRIIEALHHVMAFTSMVFEESEVEISPERKAEIESSYQKARIDLRMATDVGDFIISNDVAKILAELEWPDEVIEQLISSDTSVI